MKRIDGGVCAPIGFRAAGVHAGIRKNKSKKDLALIVSDVPCAAAGVYTTNLVKGAPIPVTQRHIANGRAQAIVANSGNANTCNADGEEVAERMCAFAAAATGIPAEDVIVASTGVIGQPLDTAPIERAMPALAAALGDFSSDASEAIMTTDTVKKEIAVEFELGGKTCRLGGIAKGSGMICPNMATMLVFLTTDAAISPEMLQRALSRDVRSSFNMVSVDGDTSTNDMLVVLANGKAGNATIAGEGEDFAAFAAALSFVTTDLCKRLAKDGEGATKLIEVSVRGAKDDENAKIVAMSVVKSNLLKAAMFGADANWGRVLCAIGYSGADVDIGGIALSFSSAAGSVAVCEKGAGIPFSEEIAKKVLSEDEIRVEISCGAGEGKADAWGCDLTYDYVKINGDYRT